MPGLQVTVELDVLDTPAYSHDHRSITLTSPDYQATIGRSTSSSQGPAESGTNALFSSRVISRTHGLLKANPQTRAVTIEDANSMHGIHCNGRRLEAHRPEPLYDGAIVTLGAEVDRAEPNGSMSSFKPIKFEVYWNWSDGLHSADQRISDGPDYHVRNSFTADYSEDSDVQPESPYYSEDEVRSVSVVEVPRVFTVPLSDLSDDPISIASDDYDGEDAQSPTSSPLGSVDLVDNNKVGDNAAPVIGLQDYPTPIEVDSEEDSYYDDSSIFDGDGAEHEEDRPQVIRAEEQTTQTNHRFTLEIPVAKPQTSSSMASIEVGVLEDISDYGMRQKVRRMAGVLVNRTVRDCYLALREHRGSYDDAVNQLLMAETFPPSNLSKPAPMTNSQHQSQSSVPEPIGRQPSPSDAAMVKPAAAPKSPTVPQRLPSIHEIRIENPAAYPADCSFSDPVRSQSAWAGHNSVLYEPMPVMETSYYTDAPALPPSSYGRIDSPENSYRHGFDPYINSPHMVFTEDVIKEIPELATQPSETIEEEIAEVPNSSRSNLSTVSAINTEITHQVKSSRKRKLDEVAADESVKENKRIDPPSTPKKSKAMRVDRHSDEEFLAIVDATDPSLSSAELPSLPASLIIEPPKKKSKKSKDDSGARTVKQGTSFVKFAATAMTGVAIGAVGAVFGLAALPADFFL